jgi:hypothetical protein
VRLVGAAAALEVATAGATLAAAARAGLLVERAGKLRFSHALVREGLYRDLDPERRRALHGTVAAALERLHAGALPVAELAHHLIEGPTARLPAAVDYAVSAVARALDVMAHEEAVALLARAQAAVEAAGDPPFESARVLLALGEARIRRGDAGPGKAACLEAAALARKLADPELLARTAIAYGQVFTFGIVDPVLVSLLEESLSVLPAEDSPLRVHLMARLASALQPSPTTGEPVRVAREAIASARRLGDPATLLAALNAGMGALVDVVNARERLPLDLEGERLADELDDRDKLLRAKSRLIVDLVELGDLQAADLRIDAFEALARELRASWYLWRAPMLRSMRAMMHGRFAESEALATEALRIGREAHDPQAERTWALHREGLLRAWERHDEMLAFDPVTRRARGTFFLAIAWQSSATALAAARAENVEQARLYLDLVPPELRPWVDNAYGNFFLTDAVAMLGPQELAEKLIGVLQHDADRDLAMGPTCLLWEGPVVRLLALLEARAGRWEEARRHFEAAIARCQQLDARPYLARTRYEYGRALLERGRPEDRAAARAPGEAARAIAEALGMAGLVRLADVRLADAGAAPAAPAARADDAAAFSLAPEGEYWTVAHQGRTFRLKDSLGLRYIARLVAEPGRELHVLDLVGARADEVDRGDAGELLDDEARDSYRRRLEDLREELAEAERFGDGARAARTREEIEFLAGELSRAVGLGGRARRAGGAGERARSAVQRRIKNAVERIGEHDAELAAYLGRSIRTGTFCVFRPAGAG